jgi:pimeloyl-ACP methyl ester carboxylesterase
MRFMPYSRAVPTLGKHRYVEVPGIGRARGTLVLLHAFPLSGAMWEPQLAVAELGWRVIAPHLRGFGVGTAEPPVTSVDDYAGDVIDLLDALHVEDAVIGGLSMGGYVAFALLRRAPAYVRALILADTRSQADTAEGVEGRRKMLQRLAESPSGPAAVIDEMLPKLLGEATRATRPDVVERVRSIALANPAGAIAGAIRAMMSRPDSTPLLRTLRCPTLIIAGDEDALTPPALSEEMHRAISGSTLVVVPRAGHLSNLEQPEAFNSALARFLTHQV